MEAVQARATAAEERAAKAELLDRERKAQLMELMEKLEFLQVYDARVGMAYAWLWYTHS